MLTRWLILAGLIASLDAQAREPLSVDDVVQLKTVTDPQISPDGDRIMYVVARPQAGEKPDTDLWLVPADGGSSRRFTRNPGPDHHPRFSPDGQRVAFLSARPDDKGKVQLYLIPVDGGEARRLTDEAESIEAFAWSPSAERIAYSVVDPVLAAGAKPGDREHDHFDSDDVRHRRLKILSLRDSQSRTISPGDVSVFHFCWSPDASQLAVFVAKDRGASQGYWNATLVMIDSRTAKSRSLVSASRSSRVAFSPDGRHLAMLGPPGKSYTRPSPSVVRVSDGRVRLLSEDHQGTAWDFVWAPDGQSLILWGHQSTEGYLGSVPIAGGQVTPWFHGCQRAWGSPALSISQDGRWIAYLAEHPFHPTEVFLTARGRKPRPGRRLTVTNPDIEKRRLGQVEPFRWKATDGKSIHGVVVHPVGPARARPAPTVVMVHGGPQWQWWRGWLGGWHEPAQLLAGHGYRVLLPNPRGSTGRGGQFAAAAFADWGGNDLGDVLAGVDALVQAGLADPERLGILGWSYGGYLTSWAITQTDRFKAAVAGAAVTNLLSFQGTSDIPLFLPDQFGVSPYREPSRFVERSPVFLAHRAVTPTLVIHGEADIRVPVTQGREFHQALSEAGVRTRLITFPREGHHFREPGHQRVWLQELLAWLDGQLMPGKPDQ